MKAMVSPFFNNSDSDADVVLRSCDNILFYVHKLVLRLASPVFRDVFSVPQPLDSDAQVRDAQSDLPLIPVSESSTILECLLRFSYPGIANTDIDTLSLSEIGYLLDAAIKYEVTYFVGELKATLLTIAHRDPVAVYTIACRLSLEFEAGFSAERTLNTTELEYSDAELDTISAGMLHRLMTFRSRGIANVGDFTFCHPAPRESRSASGSRQTRLPWPPTEVPDASLSPDIILRTADGATHPAHKSILQMSSTILLHNRSTSTQEHGSFLPIVEISEDSLIFRVLLHLCYPCVDPVVEDLDTVSKVLEAATKYRIKRAVAFAKRICMSSLESNPLRVFLIATRHEWEQEALEAARVLVLSSDHSALDPYFPEMELIPASTYHRLLEYRRKCDTVLDRVVDSSRRSSLPNRRRSNLGNNSRTTFPVFIRGYEALRNGSENDPRRPFVLALPLLPNSSDTFAPGNEWPNDALLRSWTQKSEELQKRLCSELDQIDF
ncbi:hypothetical protein WOLCODRAFT_164079 [Wolfiporia cocos MD-104 SS10]|uniref:BTB domain-containing protein n=1 Tax=Wolfiporia cocos (strain MD-104) TaxID=742152 RepID=A0A2H3JL05_WOLCO|nr:hypothetical protein WOLCODRAFT_164079 [Wolfiporia cocos MD-104 SS10]